jgi:phosphatidylserine decarboxylase
LRKKREDATSTNTSDTDQAEICCQFGLMYKSDSGTIIPSDSAAFAEDWQYLLDDEEDDAEVSALSSSPPITVTNNTISTTGMPEMKKSSSTTSFSSRFRRPLKKDNSTSSINSLTPSIEKQQQQPKRGKRLKNKFRRRRSGRRTSRKKPEGGYAKFYSDVMGITFLEIESAKDLPPEKNVTRTGFDMDPFVIVSYGISTFRTRAIRHNLNPTWNEKLFFHVRNTQENYKIKFAIYDKDKFSGNDFVASQEISIADIIQKMPTSITSSTATPTAFEEGDNSPSQEIERNMGRHTIPLNLAKPDKWKDSCHPTLTIRAKFVPYVEIRKMFWIALAKTCDADNSNTMSRLEVQTMLETLGSNISESTLDQFWEEHSKDFEQDLTMDELVTSLESFIMAVDTKQNDYDPNTIIEEEKDLAVDAKNNGTINPFFLAASDDEEEDEDDDEGDDYDDLDEDDLSDYDDSEGSYSSSHGEYDEDDIDLANSGSTTTTAPQSPDEADYEALAEADGIQYIDGPLKELKLQEDKEGEVNSARHPHKSVQEKVIRLNECPICHKPNLSKRGQMDIVTHVATCAANDWTTVDRFLMGNFGSEAQAQRK